MAPQSVLTAVIDPYLFVHVPHCEEVGIPRQGKDDVSIVDCFQDDKVLEIYKKNRS